MDGGKGQRRLMLFLALVTVVGIGALYLLGSGVEPEPVALASLAPSMAGQSVSVQGQLVKAKASSSGVWLTLSDTGRTAELDVFVPADDVSPDAGYLPGSVWSVEGELVYEDGRFKMYLPDAGMAKLVRPASDNAVPLPMLCQSPELYEGLQVVTAGRVESSYSSNNSTSLYLSAPDGAYNYTLACTVSGTGFTEGATVRVAGTLVYDSLRARYQLRSSLPPTVISP